MADYDYTLVYVFIFVFIFVFASKGADYYLCLGLRKEADYG